MFSIKTAAVFFSVIIILSKKPFFLLADGIFALKEVGETTGNQSGSIPL